MARYLPFAVAVMLLAASGVIEARRVSSNAGSATLAACAGKLRRVPTAIRDWSGSDLAIDRRAEEMGGITASLSRRYENSRGEVVSVMLVVGRPGPISVHTPEVCYAGAGFQQKSPATKIHLISENGAFSDELWSVDFRRPGNLPSRDIRIYYGWNFEGDWSAASNPRLEYAGSGALFKIYIVGPPPLGAPEGDSPGLRFARLFLPELRAALFSVTPTPPASGILHVPSQELAARASS